MKKSSQSKTLFGGIILVLLFMAAACTQRVEPTLTPEPSATITSSSTVTETPTVTATIPPTKTLKPSWTPRPSWTPKPTGTPLTTPGTEVTCTDCVSVDSFTCSIAMSLAYLADSEDITSCEKTERYLRMSSGTEFADTNYRDPEWLTTSVEAYMEKLGIAGTVEISEPLDLYSQLMEMADADSVCMVVFQLPDDLHAMILANFTEEDGYVFLDPMWREYWTPFTEELFEQEYGYKFEDVWLVTYNIRRD